MEPYKALLQLLFIVLLSGWLTRLAWRRMRKLNDAIDSEFEAALRRNNIVSHEVLLDRTSRGGGQGLTQVHRILLDDNGQYYLYVHISDSPGVIKALSQERALLALAK